MRFFLLTILPIVAAGAASVLTTFAALQPAHAPALRAAAIGVAIGLMLLLVVKAAFDRSHERSLKQTRFGTLSELHRRLAPALNRVTELALSEGDSPNADAVRDAVLRDIASQCAGALVGLIADEPREVRACVFRLVASTQRIEPIGWSGRADVPRTFETGGGAGAEVLRYLRGDRLEAELYEDIRDRAPEGYGGDTGRYRTFIRVPLWSTTGVVFGMLTVDAPRARSLTLDHRTLAELIAAELEPAFAAASL